MRPDLDAFNLASIDFWTGPHTDEALARLRAERPIAWHEHPDTSRGFWSLTTHAHIAEASTDTAQFTSTKGLRIAVDPEMGLTQSAAGSFLTMDPPEHTGYRRLVSALFTPKAIKAQMPYMRERARSIVDQISSKGRVDFFAEVASQMPLHMVSNVLGIPESDRDFVHGLVNTALDDSGDESRQEMAVAAQKLHQYGSDLAEERRNNPGTDVLSELANAELNGRPLTPRELGAFFAPLFVAGNETTRAAMCHGLIAISDNDALREPFLTMSKAHDFRLTAELMRWCTPVRSMLRTAVNDADFHGVSMKSGDKVVMWYTSANRDETVFEDPNTFDPIRNPNRQTAFGTGGPHYCIGNNLAQREIFVLFEELLSALPDIHYVGTPLKSRSAQFNSFDRLDAEFTPR
jgi:cytochrome P450